MPTPELHASLLAGLKSGSIVPYLGPGVLADVRNTGTDAPMPATSDELILAMNGGKPMSPKLMYEFPRAAMNIELKRGRTAVTKFLDATYGTTQWSRSTAHEWIKTLQPRYAIDINRDMQLLDSYAGMPHLLILGCARISGTDYRCKLFVHNGKDYTAMPLICAELDPQLPELQPPPGEEVDWMTGCSTLLSRGRFPSHSATLVPAANPLIYRSAKTYL